uniref:16S rRNA (uracil(1498)-N(3))-methyltransferase n=1 Tax=Manihot esculenta TaxID=3983 RepID=A0A2C9V4M9_MANES
MQRHLLLPIQIRFAEFLTRQWLKPSRLRAFSCLSDYSNQSRGSLLRFFLRYDQFWHMTKVLRLSMNSRAELFNGKGGLLEGCIQRIGRTSFYFPAVEDPKLVLPDAAKWHVFAAFGTLSGGQAHWLVHKCTVVILEGLISLMFEGKRSLSFLAAAEAAPLVSVLASSRKESRGRIIVGQEGDLTERKIYMTMEAGATAVGIGPLRLHIETATMALLATPMLWSDPQQLSDLHTFTGLRVRTQQIMLRKKHR